jgi:hypothetical protein
MIENSGERRKWPRASIRLPAQYFIKDSSSRFQDCTVISMSRSGASVLLPGYEFIKEKGFFYLDFFVPKTVQQLSIRGQVRMKCSQRGGIVAGIQFDKLLPEHTFNKITETERLKGWLSGIHQRFEQTASAGRGIG